MTPRYIAKWFRDTVLWRKVKHALFLSSFLIFYNLLFGFLPAALFYRNISKIYQFRKQLNINMESERICTRKNMAERVATGRKPLGWGVLRMGCDERLCSCHVLKFIVSVHNNAPWKNWKIMLVNEQWETYTYIWHNWWFRKKCLAIEWYWTLFIIQRSLAWAGIWFLPKNWKCSLLFSKYKFSFGLLSHGNCYSVFFHTELSYMHPQREMWK